MSDTPPRSAIRAKSNGKRERSPHSTRHPGTSKRAADPVDARNGQSQHSPAKRAHCSPGTRRTTSPRRKKERTRTSRSTSRSASTNSEREGRKGSRRRRPDPPGSSDCSTSDSISTTATVRIHCRPLHHRRYFGIKVTLRTPSAIQSSFEPVSYTHLTLPTNREV